MRTGTLTSPKEIDPVQMARGMGRCFPAVPRAEPSRPPAAYPAAVALRRGRRPHLRAHAPRPARRGAAGRAARARARAGRGASRAAAEPFGETAWEDDLAASRRAARPGAATRWARCSTRASGRSRWPADCALALGTLPALAARRPDARVLWLDAHSDYDTPATSSYSFLGCMSLSGRPAPGTPALGDARGAGARRPRRHAGAAGRLRRRRAGRRRGERDDARAHRRRDGARRCSTPSATRRSTSTSIPTCSTRRSTRCRTRAPAACALDALIDLLAAVAARGPVLGLELTAFHSDDDRGAPPRAGRRARPGP